jgi:hypothetical protein
MDAHLRQPGDRGPLGLYLNRSEGLSSGFWKAAESCENRSCSAEYRGPDFRSTPARLSGGNEGGKYKISARGSSAGHGGSSPLGRRIDPAQYARWQLEKTVDGVTAALARFEVEKLGATGPARRRARHGRYRRRPEMVSAFSPLGLAAAVNRLLPAGLIKGDGNKWAAGRRRV